MKIVPGSGSNAGPVMDRHGLSLGPGRLVITVIIPARHQSVRRLLARVVRVRHSENNDTPIPPDMPAAENPPTGAVIDYYLKAPAGDVTIAVYDAENHLVRRLSSAPEAEPSGPAPNIPAYWIARSTPLSTAAGMTRAVWDLRYPPPVHLQRAE